MEAVNAVPELREAHVLEGHTDRVWGLAWNPRPQSCGGATAALASCSGDKSVRVWVPEAGDNRWRCLAVLEDTHNRTIRSCAWSPNGELLATASFDATTAVWKYIGGDFECVATLEGHDNEVKSVAWSCSGSFLATCSRDKTVWIWELQPGTTFECISVLQGHTQDVKMVQWHPLYDALVSVSYDNSIKVWADDGDDEWLCVQTLDEACCGHSSTVWALSFNQNGHRMVTCSDDSTVKIWDAISDFSQMNNDAHQWKHLCTLSGYHSRPIYSIHWSSDGIIASGAGDDTICLFKEISDDSVDGPSYALLLKRDDAHSSDVNSVRWNPNDPHILASASDDGTVKIWELKF